ncbi:MAG: hypothetical protein K8I03_12885, partial [Ignavibacteria bacterium]|nr:hypothetical protein [Ignavibacteria bacterium]
MLKFSPNKKVSVNAHKGDAMTLLAFDLAGAKTENFVGFTIHVKANTRKYYLNNKLSFKPSILTSSGIEPKKKLSTLYSPIQKYRWVHVPSSEHYIDNPYFGNYTYEVSARYMVEGKLQKIDPDYTASVTIDVSPFKDGEVQVSFTRAFVSSQAYAYHFGNNSKMRPNKTDLVFDIKQKSGSAKRWDNVQKIERMFDYTFEEQHEYLGWQARDRIMEFLDEAINDPALNVDVFAYDLNEPTIVQKIITLAKEGRVRVILDDAGSHSNPTSWEAKFEKLFKQEAKDIDALFRGNYSGLAHSKIFILKQGNNAVKVLTGSTNFTTNGIYINANHLLIFSNPAVAKLYADVFDASFGDAQMSSFKASGFAKDDHLINQQNLPDMTIRFSPHTKAVTEKFFGSITKIIKDAESDILFAIMIDDSKSDILDAIREHVKDDKIFTYGITDGREGLYLYKPDSKHGVKVSGKKTETALPPPFNKVADIPGHNIHHKFIVKDFKGTSPVVYCGSSNLAFGPEQGNGDNLLEIRDKDVVTCFAIEAIRLVDHFQWRNKKFTAKMKEEPLYLRDPKDSFVWY